MISRHERRLLNRIKRMASNNTNKFQSNTIVMCHRCGTAYIPAFIEDVDNSNEAPGVFRYRVTLFPDKPAQWVPEGDLRHMTVMEALWFRHPKAGHMMIGKNRALPLLIWAAIMLACSVASLSLLGFWRWFWPIVTVLSFALVFFFSVANIKGTVR